MSDSLPPNPPSQVTVGSLLRESLAEVTSLDRGLLWTGVMLWREPRRVVDGALAMDPRVTRPLRFLLIVLALTSLPLLLLGDGTVAPTGGFNATTLWQKLIAADEGGRSLAFNLGWLFGTAFALAARDYPHVSLVLCAPLLAFGLSWAFRSQRGGAAVALIAALYALGVLYPLALAAKLLDGRAPVLLALLPVLVAAVWWPWFTASVYRSTRWANLYRAALVPGLTLIGAVIVLLFLLFVAIGLAKAF